VFERELGVLDTLGREEGFFGPYPTFSFPYGVPVSKSKSDLKIR
jgi:hypothetical protein